MSAANSGNGSGDDARRPYVNGNGNGRATNASGNGQAIPALELLLPTVREGRLRKILQLIEQEPARRIHDLAIHFNLSQSYLEHLFKQETGICLGHLLQEQRLQRAARLLTESNMSIKEIAYTVGYEHTSSFIRAFERRFESAPRQYRRLNAA